MNPFVDERPLVSVIMPAYNARAWIEQALESALAQTYSHLEIIVVDDGSRDDTPALVEAIARRDSRVCLIRQQNAGVAMARNRAIAESSGEFIAPLDADDVWMPEKIERQVECMRRGGEEVGLVYSWWISIDEDNRVLTPGAHWDAQGDVLEALLFCNFIGNASVPLFRRTALDKVGGYNSELRAQGAQGCEDWEISLRIAEHFKVACAPAYLCCYRDVSDSMAKNCPAMAKSHALVARQLRERQPHIAPGVFRWSRGLLLFWLMGLSYSSGRYAKSLMWSARLLCTDPVAATSPWVLQTALRSLLWTLARPITRWKWKDRGAYVRYKARKTPPPHIDWTEFNQTAASLESLPMWNAKGPWSFYENTCLRRWASLSSGVCASSSSPAPLPRESAWPLLQEAEVSGWAPVATRLKGAK